MRTQDWSTLEVMRLDLCASLQLAGETLKWTQPRSSLHTDKHSCQLQLYRSRTKQQHGSGRDLDLQLARSERWQEVCRRGVARRCLSMPVSDQDLVDKLRELLKDVDMETTTGKFLLGMTGLLLELLLKLIEPARGCPERKLRESLESHFNEELKSKKHVISEEVSGLG